MAEAPKLPLLVNDPVGRTADKDSFDIAAYERLHGFEGEFGGGGVERDFGPKGEMGLD